MARDIPLFLGIGTLIMFHMLLALIELLNRHLGLILSAAVVVLVIYVIAASS